MSQQYDAYGGNPYGQNEGAYGSAQSNPYSSDYASSNPYGGGYAEQPNPHAHTTQNVPHTDVPLASGHDAATGNSYGATEQHGARPLNQEDFLARVSGAKERINQLTADIQAIANIHQRMLSSPDNRSSTELEAVVSQTQIRNTQIKDEIKFLERDAARDPSNSLKQSQVKNLKSTFKKQLEDFQREEADYSKRYRDAIGRQYRIINPEATEAEVQEAQNSDWGDEGIFTQALKSNRSGQASSVLGAVRARHNDIQRIEKTMSELALLFTQLNEQVVYQEAQVVQAEEQTTQVKGDTEKANTQLHQGIQSARRARKLKWWTLFVFVLILAIIGLVLGIYFGVVKK